MNEAEYGNNYEFVPAEQMDVFEVHDFVLHDENHSGDQESDFEEIFYHNDEFF